MQIFFICGVLNSQLSYLNTLLSVLPVPPIPLRVDRNRLDPESPT